jgi:gamma-glutamyltranspeptidase
MDDFSIQGRSQYVGTREEIKPASTHKRMLRFMTPTIVEKNEKLYDHWFSWRFDVTTVLQTILNIYRYNFSGSG